MKGSFGHYFPFRHYSGASRALTWRHSHPSPLSPRGQSTCSFFFANGLYWFLSPVVFQLWPVKFPLWVLHHTHRLGKTMLIKGREVCDAKGWTKQNGTLPLTL